MFSGKSEELIRRVTRYQIARVPIQTFKPQLDIRYADSEVVSHSSLKVEAIPVETSSELLRRVDDSTQVIGIDEGQFFDDGLMDVVEQLASAEKQVIVAGLDTDYLRRPFEPIPTLCDRCRVRDEDARRLSQMWRAGHVHPADSSFRGARRPRGARRLRGAVPCVLRPDRARTA